MQSGNLPDDQQKELERFPEALKSLVREELAAGNVLRGIEHGFPAAPIGAYAMFQHPISSRARQSGGGLRFHERNSSHHAGEFTDQTGHFYVLEAPLPAPPPPDMDAIRRSLEIQPQPGDPGHKVPDPARIGKISGASGDGSSQAVRAPVPVTARTPDRGEMASQPGQNMLIYSLLFEDPRPPESIAAHLEGVICTLFTAERTQRGLSWHAVAFPGGAHYSLLLQFLAAFPDRNRYRLELRVSWNRSEPGVDEYYGKSSKAWFAWWTNDFRAIESFSDEERGSAELYERFSEQALAIARRPMTVASLQQEILAAIRQGATLATSHKEGGTRFGWCDGRYFRYDWGDSTSDAIFPDETGFLVAIASFFQHEINRNADREGHSGVEFWRLLQRRLNTP